MRQVNPIQCAALAACLAAILFMPAPASGQTDSDASPQALQQIRELLQEKESRTPSQRKLGTQIVYAVKASSGQGLTPGILSLPGGIGNLDVSPNGGVLVDMRASVSDELLAAIAQAGGRVIHASSAARSIRARLPLGVLESFAARGDVSFIKPGSRAKLNGVGIPGLLRARGLRSASPRRPPSMLPTPLNLFRNLGLSFIGSVTTQGDVTHTANQARTAYGVNGSGVRVGVLSDSAEALSFLIGTGDLPPGARIVADLVDGPGTSEGTAMMEIVYDIAPGVQLFFASAANGPHSFADNIRMLRNTYNCDIIVDDLSYSDESPFADGPVAQAVDDVTAAGALYFSSAGNSGNLTSRTASTWEGDFTSAPANPLLPGYTLHSFAPGQAFNRVASASPVLDFFWSDPLGGSGNDYDLFVLNAAGTAVLYSSTDIQDGTQDPFEELFVPAGIPANSRVVIAAKAGAERRALHLETFFGIPLTVQTSGATHGHNGGPATISVAATAWNSARIGTRPFLGGASNPTELFSSDGPRKMFYYRNGAPITPGNLLFGTNGGITYVKPDFAAADGVTARTPGFSPFFGTSAAAPHAAAIAALVKSARPAFRPVQIYDALLATALDIDAPGTDRDSGFGLLMAAPAVAQALK